MHTFDHEIRVAAASGLLGSIDANQGYLLLGWDTDEFPTDLNAVTLAMYDIIKAGGLGTGGVNFDAKVRRSSTDLNDLFLAHIAGMDTFARGLKTVAKLIEDKFFKHLNFKETHIPNGMNPDTEVECAQYDAILATSGLDLQLLGIGTNGHIAFNEPTTNFELTTHVEELVEDTIKANSRFFESIDDVPKTSYTMRIKSIMQAKEILLIASGFEKAKTIKAMLEGPVTEEVPASILQTHPNVIVIIDEEAASLIDPDLLEKVHAVVGIVVVISKS